MPWRAVQGYGKWLCGGCVTLLLLRAEGWDSLCFHRASLCLSAECIFITDVLQCCTTVPSRLICSQLVWVESRLQAKGCWKMKTCCWIKGKMKTFLANRQRGLISYILQDTATNFGTSGGFPESAYSERHVDNYKTNHNQKCLLWKNWTGKPGSAVVRGFLAFSGHREHNSQQGKTTAIHCWGGENWISAADWKLR